MSLIIGSDEIRMRSVGREWSCTIASKAMAEPSHLALISGGIATWNKWRAENADVIPQLREADLRGAELDGFDLHGARMRYAYLRGAKLRNANLSNADLTRSDLCEATLIGADLRGASLGRSNLYRANFFQVNFTGADLSGASLVAATFVECDFTGVNLSGCRVYGTSVWKVKMLDALQTDLCITPKDEPTVQVDNLAMAQFIYLLLNNANIREVLDNITAKVVLILGRFSTGRKPVLERLRLELRRRGFSPMLFDFEKPESRNLTETISTLAHMARFVIADISEARSIPQELSAIVPHLPSVPVQPLLSSSDTEYGMFEHFRNYPWVLPLFRYRDQEHLLVSLEEQVIGPPERRAELLRRP
jgi:hypothetical protein